MQLRNTRKAEHHLTISWDQALTWRLRQQHLIERESPENLEAVVGRLCGLHAQAVSSIDLALWARIEGLHTDHVADALWRRRSLIKMWAMRATLHVLPAKELGTWVAGLSIWKPGVWPLKGIDPTPLGGFVDRALRGRIMTRKELAAAVSDLGATRAMVDRMLSSWSASLRYASFAGHLCFAPSEGQEARFTHPATWLKKPPAKCDRDKSFDALTLRYLGAYGPATAHDLGPRWWGINQREAKLRLAAIAKHTSEVSIDGVRYWMLTQDVAGLTATKPVNVVRLLPAFDQWVVNASRRVPAFLDPQFRQRIYRLQGWVSPVVLVNGRMVGVWKHSLKGHVLSVDVEPFEKLPRSARPEVAAEAERLASFLGRKLKLTIQR